MTNDPEQESGELVRASFTLSHRDLARLRQIARWRREEDPRAASATLRELIREAYEREKEKQDWKNNTP